MTTQPDGPTASRRLDTDELVRRARASAAACRPGLERLISIPSISLPGFDPAQLRVSAAACAEQLARAGFEEVEILELPGAPPAVFASCPPPSGMPTVLLYAHHDVQPPGVESEWKTPPFVAVERGGRLYGRGAADDKAAIAIHTAIGTVFRRNPPVGLSVLIEGEEEPLSPHLPEFVSRFAERLRADVVVVLDGSNPRMGKPALTTSLRGLVDCVVEVRTFAQPLHSGDYGGPFPDALTVLARLLATLHDERGRVTVDGLISDEHENRTLDEEELLSSANPVPGLRVLNDGTLAGRLWSQPAVTVLGIDAPTVGECVNQLAARARAKISLRLAPGDDAGHAMRALARHLEQNVSWGAELRIEPRTAIEPFSRNDHEGWAHAVARSALRDAWGIEPAETGSGASIPAAAVLTEAIPEASLLITGVADPACRAHAPNESVHLGDYERACIAEALLVHRLADEWPKRSRYPSPMHDP